MNVGSGAGANRRVGFRCLTIVRHESSWRKVIQMKQSDGRKRSEWQKRLQEFAGSGLTVEQFCREVGVPPHTFYYWKRRLKQASNKRGRYAIRELTGKGGEGTPAAATGPQYSGPHVHFSWGSALRVSVPVHCVDAIRCVLECAHGAGPISSESAKTFQEVVLAK